MKTLQVEGIILKRRNSGEADRILTVFTKDFGKIQIKAIGVRKIASKRSSHIELLNISSISLYKGRSVPILTEATTIENFDGIKTNLGKIGLAYHICELIDGLCPENQEYKEIFYLLLNTLEKLSTQDDVLSIIHDFEVALLTSLGYFVPSEKLHSRSLSYLIEGILERKLKTRQILYKLL